ncbi:CHAT domain-containing tetratricopeptide repeat protein [Streptomyces justiciae]|uniref:CHAT domain-containing tetratricopeptide repeat protein n=1 Tax=Streptomyces justiciae TaxID=2780140 RepID=UPI0018811982|nr:CHAT domain-containing protein [Streptomyces justiciae]MBE8475992.1 CHAT domain-containing protein [Streptomyces justiciae]
MYGVELAELTALLDDWLALEGDPDPLAPEVSKRAERLAVLLDRGDLDPVAATTLVRYLWRRFWRLPVGTGMPVLRSATTLAIRLPDERRAELPPQLRTLLAVDPSGDADRWAAAGLTGNPAPDRSIALLGVAAQLTAADSAERAAHLGNLSNAYYRRFLESQSLEDLDGAISALREASTLFGTGFHQLPDLLFNLSLMLRTRFRARGDAADLAEAIDRARSSVELAPDRAEFVSGLALSVRLRYEQTGRTEDLDEAIGHARRAAALVGPHHEEARIVLTDLAWLLAYRHSLTGEGLAEAVRVARDAAMPVLAVFGRDPEADAQYEDTLEVLLELLTRQYQQDQDQRDLDDALRAVTSLLSLAPGRPAYLRTLRSLLLWRAVRDQNLADLSAAVDTGREILAADDGENAKEDTSALARLLLTRFEATDDLADAAAAALLWSHRLGGVPGRRHPLAARARQVLERIADTADPRDLSDRLLSEPGLAAMPLGTAQDLGALCMFGWLLWLRAYYQQDDAAADRDRQRAAELFAPVHQVDAAAVPEPLAEYFERSAAQDVSARLNSAGMNRLHEYERTENAEDALEAIRLLRRAAQTADHPADEAAAANNLAIILTGLPPELATEQLLREAVGAARRAVELSPADEPYLPGRLSNLCVTLCRWYDFTGDPQDLEDAITAGRQGTDLTPEDHPSAGMHWGGLARALARRTDPADEQLHETVNAYRRAIDLLPGGHRARPAVLLSFATFLTDTRLASDEPAAIAALREAAGQSAPGPLRARILGVLVASLRRASEFGEAIDRAHELLRLTPAGSAQAQSLAVEIAGMAQADGDPDAVRRAAQALLANVQVPAVAEPVTPAQLAVIGLTLLSFADTLADQSLRASALTALRNAVSAAHPDDPRRTAYQAALVTALRENYLRTRDVTLLREEIELADEVLARTPDDDPELLLRLEAGTWVLQRLHSDLGDRSRLDDTLDRAQRAARHPDSDWFAQLTLAEVLIERGRVAGDVDLMERGIQIGREYLPAGPPEDEDQRRALGNFATGLSEYYTYTGASEVLDEAIALARRAVDGRGGHLTGARNTLAQCLSLRYEHTGDAADLRESVRVGRQAAAAVPVGYPYRGLYLDSLRSVLQTLGELDEDIDLLNEAADTARAARACAVDNPAFAMLGAIGLAETLLLIHRRTGDASPLTEARRALEEVLPGNDDHPGIDRMRHVLAQVLVAEAEQSADATGLERARRLEAQVATAESGTNHNRLISAKAWASLAMRLEDPEDALRACETAAGLLLVHVGPALRRADRELGLRDSSWLPRTVAAAALSASRPERAVELLEQVRGILMAEALHARQDLSALRALAPDLAEEFTQLSARLAAGHRDHEAVAAPGSLQAVQDRIEAARRWRQVVDRIRELPGHSRFLRPPSIDALQEGIDGAIVVVTTSEWRSDALILDGHTVTTVDLPGLTVQNAVSRTNTYLVALQEVQRVQAEAATASAEAQSGDLAALQRHQAAGMAVVRARAAMERTLTDTLEWLWDTIAAPVLHHLDPQGTPRVWWCPTGPLTLLPLHAAGRHPDGSVIERVVSSYTPTIRAFQAARSAPAPMDPARLLIVALPESEGQQPLPNVARERDLLLNRVHATQRTLLEGAAATREAVRRELAHHSWIHFSCHGDQDLRDPSRGGVLLSDGVLSIVDIAGTSGHAELTLLSACKTATGGTELTDEAMTLAAALHYSGSRHVIATLWSVYDPVAADISDQVYRHLLHSGRLTAQNTARALHEAIGHVRRTSPRHPSTWIPFIHIGP